MIRGPDSGRGGIQVGVDIGGTFTDIVLCRSDGRLHVKKVSSTPSDPSQAVIAGLGEVLAENGLDPAGVDTVVHGTTVGSNCILERTGARTGLLTTKGFRDVLEIGRIRTPDMFDLEWDKPRPLVRRRLRLEADERIAADGSVVRPLDEDSVRSAAEVFKAEGVESVAVCFLNSYRNPAHEQSAASLLRRICADMNVTASCAVLPEMKEYERTSTTVVNAFIQPVMRRYIRRLEAGLRDMGVTAPLLVVASNGGILSAGAMAERPVFAVGSGPAAGVAGAARLGKALGEEDLIVFDMGGTTAKASLVEAGHLTLTSEYEFRDGITTPSRFIKAGGYMLKVPAIDIAEVGAGAGSIAWLDAGGLINVGPRSAGAEPGPACYGLGGDKPTVTDANVALGYLNPESLAGGRLKIDASLAEAAISGTLGALGLGLTQAAYGIRRVANANMARAIRAVSIERGRDPRRFTMIAFGGSGPVHAVRPGPRAGGPAGPDPDPARRLHRRGNAGQRRRASLRAKLLRTDGRAGRHRCQRGSRQPGPIRRQGPGIRWLRAGRTGHLLFGRPPISRSGFGADDAGRSGADRRVGAVRVAAGVSGRVCSHLRASGRGSHRDG